jgi:hypothetical protein
MMGKLAPVQESLRGAIVYGHEDEINVLQIWNIERLSLSCTVSEFSLRKEFICPLPLSQRTTSPSSANVYFEKKES